MKTIDIMECLVNNIEEKIIKEWKHEGFIGGFSSEHINFEIDGKEYVLHIREVKDEEHWLASCIKADNSEKTRRTGKDVEQ